MDADSIDGNYLGAYSRFFTKFVSNVNPDDQLPVNVNAYDANEAELVGEIISMTLHYLDKTYCPLSLQAHIVHLVIQEMKSLCKKQPEECGWRHQEKTYSTLKLMHAVTSKVNEICFRYLDNSRLALLPPPPATPLPLVTAHAVKNKRRKMEDRHVVLHDLHTIFSIQYDSVASYYAVFDGHGGQDAAVYCATHLHQYLAESIHYPTDPERALRDAFVTTDAHFTQKSQTQNVRGGTTAVCALVLGKKLYIAWVGDSMAMLVKRGSVEQLVNPHRPDREDEMQRVNEMGGVVVENYGVWRVNGILSISRAIGDVRYKPFVTGDPDIRSIRLDGTEDFLILACDGFWDFVDNDSAAMIVYEQVRRWPNDLSRVHKSLIDWAKLLGSHDNITVIVVFLTAPSEIAARPPDAHPLLSYPATDGMNNMDPNHPYLSMSNGEYDVNASYVKQQQQQQLEEEAARCANGQTGGGGGGDTPMSNDVDDDDELDAARRRILYEAATNGKHENGGGHVYDYEDFGPETDVDAVDEPSDEHLRPDALEKISRDVFTGEKPRADDTENDFRENDGNADDDDSPPSPRDTKSHQNALISEADNVADSEDSEDEWNYYRIDPNKEKDENREESETRSPDVPEKSVVENQPSEGEFHSETDVHSPEAETHPLEADVHSSEADSTHPFEGDTHSLDSQAFELGATCTPATTANPFVTEDRFSESEAHESEVVEGHHRADSQGDFFRPEEEEEEDVRGFEREANLYEEESQRSEKGLRLSEGESQRSERDLDLDEEELRRSEKDLGLDEEELRRSERDLRLDEEELRRSENDLHLSDEETLPVEENVRENPQQVDQGIHLAEEVVHAEEVNLLEEEAHPAKEEEAHPATEKEEHPATEEEEHPAKEEEAHPATEEEEEEEEVKVDSHEEKESLPEEVTRSSEETTDLLGKDIHFTEPEVSQVKTENCPFEEETQEKESLSSEVKIEEKRESEDKENVPPTLIDTDISAEEETEEPEEPTFVEQQTQQQESHGDMDFQLNPDAAEFVPVSPPILGTRMNLASDFPISGSPLKQTPPMDDIAVPSEREFEAEVCLRPREVEEDDRSNGDHQPPRADHTDFANDKQRVAFAPGGLDESEISSTKAEFGDESSTSFLTATDFHRSGISALDGSFTDSEKENYDISKDPMAMSFTPGDFQAAFEKPEVDLNAVHDLSAGDLNEQNGTFDENVVIDETESSVQSKLSFEEIVREKIDEPMQLEDADSTVVTHSAESSEDKRVELERQLSPVNDPFKQEMEFDVHKDAECAIGRNSSPFEPAAERGESSTNVFEPQEESCAIEKTAATPSTVSPVPDKTELHEEEMNEAELVEPMENVHISSEAQEVVSTLHVNAPEFKPGQKAFDPFRGEEEAVVTSRAEETEVGKESADQSETQNLLDFGSEQVSTSQPAVEPSLVAESIIEEQPKENLLELDQDFCSKQKEVIEEVVPGEEVQKEISTLTESQQDLVCPLSAEVKSQEEEIPREVEDDFVKTETSRIVEAEKHEPKVEESLNLSESVQESIATEVPATVEESHEKIHEESIAKEDLAEKEEVRHEVAEEIETVEEKKILEDVAKEPEVAAIPEPVLIPERVMETATAPEQEKLDQEPEKPAAESQEPKADSKAASIGGIAATAAAAATAVAAAGAVAAAKTKAKPTTKSTKPTTTTTKTATPKSTPTSPSKSLSSSARTSSAMAAKKTATSTASRPKQPDSKSTVSSTVSKTALAKSSTATKTATTTRPTSRVSLGAAPAKPKTAAAAPTSAKPAEKKATTNGELMKAKTTSTTGTRTAASKSLASSGQQTAKTTLVKSSTTSRATTSTSATKPRATSAVTASRPTSKPASTTTSTTGTLSTTRPKTAPTTTVTSSSSSAKSRVSSATKSPMIDKQIKETANKQISLARTTGGTAGKTAGTRASMSATATTTAKRSITSSKTTTSSLSSTSPTKKSATSTTKLKTASKISSSSSTAATAKSKVVQNGISEKTTEVVSILTNSKIDDEDIPKKDLSPVVPPTDNQLILSAD